MISIMIGICLSQKAPTHIILIGLLILLITNAIYVIEMYK